MCSFKAYARIDGAESDLSSTMLDLLFELLWSKTLSAPSIHARAMSDFATYTEWAYEMYYIDVKENDVKKAISVRDRI